MTQRSVTFATFVLHRTYPAKPSRVYRAFADPVAKARWFNAPEGYIKSEQRMDFRVGGTEVSRGKFHNGPARPGRSSCSTASCGTSKSIRTDTLCLSPAGRDRIEAHRVEPVRAFHRRR